MKFCLNCGTRLVLTRGNHDTWGHQCPRCRRIEDDSSILQEQMETTLNNLKREAPSEMVKIKMDRESYLFPYEPYLQQVEFMKDIKDIVGNGEVLVAEACNGFGKTACALASTLPMEHRIIYATRTHEQVRQVLLELESINKKSQKDFSAVTLASRQHLCLNEKCRSLSSIEAMEACRLLKETGKCPYRTEIQSLNDLPPVLSIKDLQKLGSVRKICPYFLARKASEDCTVIVAPYQYIFNEYVRTHIKLELVNKILIFDEAHNADQIGKEALSYSLSERTLNAARRELETVNVASEFIDDLIVYLEKKVSEKSLTETGVKLREDLKKVLSVNDIRSYVANFSEIVEEIRKNKIDQGNYPICFLKGVTDFLQYVDSSPTERYVAVYRTSFRGFKMIEYRCLDPSLAIRPVIEKAYGALIMSGTLAPLELYTEILGLKRATNRTYSAIADPDYVRTIIDPKVTTKFKERGEVMFRRYGERISRLILKIPNGVLLFFPQRRFMLEALSYWKKIGLIEISGNQPVLGGKRLFIEGEQAKENRSVVEEYKGLVKTGKGGVLCGVFRGRNAEGSNFPYDQARAVFLIGVPYADYSDPVVKAQIEYYNTKKRNLGERWYIMDAFRATNQAMGRGIRHRDDWCNFILMDSRYKTYKDFISKWAVVNGIKELTN